ncbi:ESX-1 secretion-associated protein [Mycolicibacterium boenickei]
MVDDLKVSTDALTRIAGLQRDLATSITAVDAFTDGVPQSVFTSHGLVCAPTIAAIGEAQMSRSAATEALNSKSNLLAKWLDHAASDYTGTDDSGKSNLDGQMHPR